MRGADSTISRIQLSMASRLDRRTLEGSLIVENIHEARADVFGPSKEASSGVRAMNKTSPSS